MRRGVRLAAPLLPQIPDGFYYIGLGMYVCTKCRPLLEGQVGPVSATRSNFSVNHGALGHLSSRRGSVAILSPSPFPLVFPCCLNLAPSSRMCFAPHQDQTKSNMYQWYFIEATMKSTSAGRLLAKALARSSASQLTQGLSACSPLHVASRPGRLFWLDASGWRSKYTRFWPR